MSFAKRFCRNDFVENYVNIPINAQWTNLLSGRVNRGAGTGGAIAPPIILGIDKILAFSTPNISRSEEGAAMKK